MVRSFTDWVGDIGISYRDFDILHSETTPHNEIILASSRSLGKILIMNNEVQHVEAWEFLYHEPFVHLPIAFLREPKKCLIIGGGSLNALREVLKYKSFESIELAEIDRRVVEIMLKANPHLSRLVEDSRVAIRNTNAYRYLTECGDRFDLILNDGLDLTKSWITKSLVRIMNDHLSPLGICSDVVYRHLFERSTTRRMLSQLKGIRKFAFSLLFIPEFPGTLHLLVIWGRNRLISQGLVKPVNLEQLAWIRRKKAPCRYYDPRNLGYFLHLPTYLKKFLQNSLRRTGA